MPLYSLWMIKDYGILRNWSEYTLHDEMTTSLWGQGMRRNDLKMIDMLGFQVYKKYTVMVNMDHT